MTTENFSIPQLNPVFSFTTQEGDEINVYATNAVNTTVLFTTLTTDELVEWIFSSRYCSFVCIPRFLDELMESDRIVTSCNSPRILDKLIRY